MMKIVKLLCMTIAVAMAVAVYAEDEKSAVSANTFGIIRVESTTENTLIAVPWTWYSEKEEDALDILAKKLVKTENLEKNDLLYRYLADGSYRAWMVVEKNGELCWKPCSTVVQGPSGTGAISIADDEDTSEEKLTWETYLEAIADDNAVTKIARGNAVWLRRQHPTDSEGKAKPFWVYGQSVSTPVSNAVTPPSGDETVRTTLLGNPYAQAVKINDLKFSATPDPMDRIFVPDGTLTPKTLMYKDGKGWRYSYTTTNSAGLPFTSYSYDIEVKPGLAFWYDRRGTGEMTITWTPPTESSTTDK